MPSIPTHSQSVLPNPDVLTLERVERVDGQFHLFAVADQAPTCPVCGGVSYSRHSCYCRCLQDLPWQGLSVQLHVLAHRYRCRNLLCPRKVFCERLPGVARSHARQTDRTCEIVRIIGYVAGGRAGERLLLRLAILTSDDTVLRRVKQPPPESLGVKNIRNLGVDDWAWRKGQNYGTILVDLDLHQVADLLADRSSESFASWLQAHPGIATVARDRSGVYAEGAGIGPPEAQQVADRFHLVLNLSAAVERVFEERSRELVLAPERCDKGPTNESARACEDDDVTVATVAELQQQQRRQRRVDRYQEVIELHKQGYSQRAISNELGLGRKTIRRWLRAGQFPERKPPVRKPAKVTHFADFLLRRWNEGCHNATRLYEEIRERGYKGKRSMVARYVSSWRNPGKPKRPDAPQRIAPKQAAILATRQIDEMTDEQQKLFERIGTSCPRCVSAAQLRS